MHRDGLTVILVVTGDKDYRNMREGLPNPGYGLCPGVDISCQEYYIAAGRGGA
jgi:hypothetical protein